MSRISRLYQATKKRLQEQFDFIVINKKSFERAGKFSMRLGTFLGLVIGIVLVLISTTSAVIVFTPIREWIPGYTDKALVRKQAEMVKLVHQMEQKIAHQESFIKSMQRMTAYGPDQEALEEPLQTEPVDSTSIPPNPVPESHPEEVQSAAPAQHESQPPAVRQRRQPPRPWMKPLEGLLTRKFDPSKRHFAIDLVAGPNSPIHCIDEGVVVLSEYTPRTGYVIGVAHPGGVLSFYKHCNRLYRKMGQYVKPGEVIAALGNSGEQSTGPHLHFELWVDGRPVNPLVYFEYADN